MEKYGSLFIIIIFNNNCILYNIKKIYKNIDYYFGTMGG